MVEMAPEGWKISSQEFVYVLARISNVKTDPEELMKIAAKSGLIK